MGLKKSFVKHHCQLTIVNTSVSKNAGSFQNTVLHWLLKQNKFELNCDLHTCSKKNKHCRRKTGILDFSFSCILMFPVEPKIIFHINTSLSETIYS